MAQDWFAQVRAANSQPTIDTPPSPLPDREARTKSWFDAARSATTQSATSPVGAAQSPTQDAPEEQSWWDWAKQPLIPYNATAPTSAMEGIENAVGSTLSGITSPESIGTVAALGAAAFAAPEIAGLAGLGFAISGANAAWQEVKNTWNSQGPERWQHGTQTIIDAAMSLAAAGGAGHEFNKAAISQLGDALPTTSKLGEFKRQLKNVLDPVNSSPAAKTASLEYIGSLSKLELQRLKVKEIIDNQSKKLDELAAAPPTRAERFDVFNTENGHPVSSHLIEAEADAKASQNAKWDYRSTTYDIPNEERNTIYTLEGMLDEKMKSLPDTAQDQIHAIDEMGANPIDTAMMKLYKADRIRTFAELNGTNERLGLMKQARGRGTRYEVYNIESDKPVTEFANESAAQRLVGAKPSKYDYRPVEGAPEGWKKVDFPETNFTTDAKGNVVKAKAFWAPEDVMQLYKNNLSGGLKKIPAVGPLYDIYRFAGSTLNQIQLGFSVFHGLFSTFDAVNSGVSFGLKKMMAGQIGEGLSKIGKSFTPFHTIEMYSLGKDFEQGAVGAKTMNPQLSDMIDPFLQSGARLKQDPFYMGNGFESWRAMSKRMLRDDGPTPKSVGATLMAIPEAIAAPLMENFVPRMKTGLFLDMAKWEMEQLRSKGASDLEIKGRMADIWKSVDNRMGQVVYDNLFWPKALKELGMVSIRSLGWNLGSVRELGGGAKDWLELPYKIAMKKNPQLTYRMAYTMTLPLVIGLYGGAMHYAMTGSIPQTTDDYFYPQTASGTRVSLPSYMKDLMEFRNNPIDTITNKLHPLAKGIWDMVSNSDFRNVRITEENLFDDVAGKDTKGIAQWFADEGLYMGKQFLPFGFVGYNRARTEGSTVPEAAMGLAGLTPAPQRVVGSDFEQKARSMISAGSPEGGRSQLQANKSSARLNIEDRIRNGKDVSRNIADALQQGLFSPDDLQQVFKDVGTSTVASLGSKLNIPDFVRAYNVATDEEKAQLIPILAKKIQTLNGMSPAQQQETLEALKKLKRPALAGPIPPPPA